MVRRTTYQVIAVLTSMWIATVYMEGTIIYGTASPSVERHGTSIGL